MGGIQMGSKTDTKFLFLTITFFCFFFVSFLGFIVLNYYRVWNVHLLWAENNDPNKWKSIKSCAYYNPDWDQLHGVEGRLVGYCAGGNNDKSSKHHHAVAEKQWICTFLRRDMLITCSGENIANFVYDRWGDWGTCNPSGHGEGKYGNAVPWVYDNS